MNTKPDRLGAYALFAALLSAAGLPIYIHAPKFFVDEYGVSLASLAGVLFLLRLLDVVQDPLFGRLSEVWRDRRGTMVMIATVIMALAMVGLFAITPPVSPLLWFGIMLTLVFSGFSFLTINFYAQGVLKADVIPGHGHLRLARWRETGALLGVCAAAVAPALLGVIMDRPFAGFAAGFAVLALAALTSMREEWKPGRVAPGVGIRVVLGDPMARRLLLIALVNAAPVAVSSTLFLFFVESRLEAPAGMEGTLLLLFFLCAALSAPAWGMLAERHGVKPMLLCAMVLAILAFGGAMTLGPGDWVLFALVCAASGAAIGADLTLLPAVFARRMAVISPSAATGFGIWSFVNKFTLAFAAVLLLPALEYVGFQSGSDTNSASALWLLSALYAGVPCALKIVAIGLLAITELKEEG